MPIVTADRYSKEEIFNYEYPPVLYTWGRMTGKEVSEAMLADIEKYYKKKFFDNNEELYKGSFKILGATVVEDEDNLMYDEVKVKMFYCGNLERRFLRLKDLYNF